jgi:hypothetical protein
MRRKQVDFDEYSDYHEFEAWLEERGLEDDEEGLSRDEYLDYLAEDADPLGYRGLRYADFL